MTRVLKAYSLLLVAVIFAAEVQAQQWFEELEKRLSFKSAHGVFRSELSGLLDLEGYYVDQRPPGLLFEEESFFNPRLSLFLDTRLGPHVYSFVQVRLDRGFDPGQKNFDARFDEYLLRWTPWTDRRVNLQIGKFATVVGSWVQRHDSWQNPFITAPLPYENPTPLSDGDPPMSPADLLARRQQPDEKAEWLPVIWGPVYATGASAFGNLGRFDYALEVKNASLSSHPYAWDPNDSLWQYPTFGGRLGFRPTTEWIHGLSFSAGPYSSSDAASGLPPGKTIGDYNQFTLDYDVSYAWKRLQLWAEVFLTRFEVPNVGNADLMAYYLESKYEFHSGLFAAARWNQEFFGSVNDRMGGREPWGNDMFRIDLALGYRFTRHLQSKLQYSFGHRRASLQQGEQLVAAQVTVRF